MKIPKSWHKVTPLSKILALILFILLPFIGFYIGFVYRGAIDETLRFDSYLRLKEVYYKGVDDAKSTTVKNY